ncbi:MAG: hypothetical protein OXN89_18960 [Bryobacterales bacterium]|nr:hypothetical protein [Bryobacterales bacterium]
MESTTTLTVAVIGTIATVVATLIAAGVALVRFGVWKGSVDTDRENFKAFMREVKEALQRLADRLPHEAATVGASPRRLTKLGERVAEDIGARVWSANVAEDLLEAVRGMQPYQVDRYCREHVRCDLSSDMKEQVDRCAYEQGLKRASVEDVLQVVLRLTLLARLEEGGTGGTASPAARRSAR